VKFDEIFYAKPRKFVRPYGSVYFRLNGFDKIEANHLHKLEL